MSAPHAASRVALVTGGLGAIGTAICRALADQGCRVGAIGHPSEAERVQTWKTGFDGEVAVELCDLGDYAAANSAVGSVDAVLGPIDILVNCAGITRDARFTKMTLQQWREVMAANLDSVFNATKPVFEGMCQRGFGRIVNISSVNGQRGQFGQANYSAAKAGMHGFTMALAQEGAAKGVTVNTVAPGYVETPLTAQMRPDILEKIVASIPVGRRGQPADIARAVAFLCAEDAGYVTGALLAVNGGLFMSA
jgi:acetoacetyl-CoA reductase